MPKGSDDRFDPRVSPPRARPPKVPKFTSRVLKALARQGSTGLGHPTLTRSVKGVKRGRGRVAAARAAKGFGIRSRRVAVKFRVVQLRKASPGNAAARLRYLQREGVSPTGERGQLYGAEQDAVEASEFEKRCRPDRHQFVLIVSPDDGVEIQDLRSFTRSLVTQVERDLGTKLEWVAADHFDTGHPHTHILIRGKAQDGRNLVISRDYISAGLRMRAAELATQWLGPRTQREIDADFDRQVHAERWTGLDVHIGRLSEDRVVRRDVLQKQLEPSMAAPARARLQFLEGMGLAERDEDGWRIDRKAEGVLRAMGERGDIIRELQRAHAAQQYQIFDPDHSAAPVVGRISARGWHEDSDRAYVLIEGVDGENHYVALPGRIDPHEMTVGAIVRVQSVEARQVDRTIALNSAHGMYRSDLHRQQLIGDPSVPDPDEFVQSHVRRLEALRRAGIVQRVEDGVWNIPVDFPERALAYDRTRLEGKQVSVVSAASIEGQTKVLAPTWLDRQLIEGTAVPRSPFGEELRQSLQERGDFLVAHGYASRQRSRLLLARNLLEQLRERELLDAGTQLQATHGLVYRPVTSGERVSGTYRQSVTLVSGRYAMLDDGVGFSLVPWRPVLADRLGQSVSATITGSRVSWEIGRKRGLSI